MINPRPGHCGQQPNQKTPNWLISEPQPKRCITDNPLFNAALDRTRISTRQAMTTVTLVLAAARIDVIQLSVTDLFDGSSQCFM